MTVDTKESQNIIMEYFQNQKAGNELLDSVIVVFFS